MILRMNIITIPLRLTFDSWIPRLKSYGSELGWDLGFKVGWSVDMVMVAPVRYPLVGSILDCHLVITLEHDNDLRFCTTPRSHSNLY